MLLHYTSGQVASITHKFFMSSGMFVDCGRKLEKLERTLLTEATGRNQTYNTNHHPPSLLPLIPFPKTGKNRVAFHMEALLMPHVWLSAPACVCTQGRRDGNDPCLFFMEIHGRHPRRKAGGLTAGTLMHEALSSRPCLHVRRNSGSGTIYRTRR